MIASGLCAVKSYRNLFASLWDRRRVMGEEAKGRIFQHLIVSSKVLRREFPQERVELGAARESDVFVTY